MNKKIIESEKCPECGADLRVKKKGIGTFYWCPDCLWNGDPLNR